MKLSWSTWDFELKSSKCVLRKVSHLISLILNFQLDFLTFSFSLLTFSLLFRTATLLMAPVVSVGTSSEDVAARVGHHVIKHQNIAIAESGGFRIAVSGGSMGKGLLTSTLSCYLRTESSICSCWDVVPMATLVPCFLVTHCLKKSPSW